MTWYLYGQVVVLPRLPVLLPMVAVVVLVKGNIRDRGVVVSVVLAPLLQLLHLKVVVVVVVPLHPGIRGVVVVMEE